VDIAPKIDVAEIIKAASTPLGLGALVLVIIAFLSLYFFKDAVLKVRIYIFLLVFVSGVGVFVAAFRAYENDHKPVQQVNGSKETPPAPSTDCSSSGSGSAQSFGDNSVTIAGNCNVVNPKKLPKQVPEKVAN
jgi:hypothetical protein